MSVSHRLSWFGACALCVVCLFTLTDLIGQEVKESPGSNAGKSEQPLEVRLAAAHLALAQADLRSALELNKRFPNAIPGNAVENYRKHVLLDQEMLEQAKKGTDGHIHAIYRRAAEIAMENAEADFARKQRLYEGFPDQLASLAFERAKAVLLVSQLNQEYTETQESSLSSLAYLQWQIEQLRNDLLELRIHVASQHPRKEGF